MRFCIDTETDKKVNLKDKEGKIWIQSIHIIGILSFLFVGIFFDAVNELPKLFFIRLSPYLL